MAQALLMVRAELQTVADRQAFDRWYEDEHLPEALDAFGAERAWRCWSVSTPGVHYAFYEFERLETAQAVQSSTAMRALAAEFERHWGSRTVRRREILELVQELKQRS